MNPTTLSALIAFVCAGALLVALLIARRRNLPPVSQTQDTEREKRSRSLLGFRKLLLSDPGYVAIWRAGQNGEALDEDSQTIYNQLLFEYWHSQQEGYLRARETGDAFALRKARDAVLPDRHRLGDAIERLKIGQMLNPDYERFLLEIIRGEGGAGKSKRS